MVKSRSSTSSLFKTANSTSISTSSILPRSPSIFSVETSLSGYDTDSIITFRPTSDIGTGISDRHHRRQPPDLQLAHSNKSQSSGRYPTYTPSLPVTPGTPQFPSDPFSHLTTLPEPTRSRPGSLAHTLERAGKGPEIVVASPSTSTVHYLFTTSISVTGNHLSAEEARSSVTRSIAGSQKKKKGVGRAPVDAFSAPTRKAKQETLGYRTSRIGSEPVVGLKESKTLDSASMRTLRRQPSLADLGARGRFREGGKGNKENMGSERGVMTLEKVVEEKKNKALGLSNRINTSVTLAPDLKALSPSLDKSNISDPISHPLPNRRRSLSLTSPRPAPSVPSPTSPESPQLPAPNFGRPLHIEVGDLIPSGSYSYIEYSANGAIPFTNPFGFPGGVPMVRGTTRVGLGGVDAGKIAARLDAERRLQARNSVHQPVATGTTENKEPMERRLSLSGRVRRSLSLKLSSETKSNRRRSQSVVARGERQWDTAVPLPSPSSILYNLDLGLGDPSVDMDDKYAPAKIPSSRSLGLGLDVDVMSDIGQRSPQRKRIDLGGSDISLLASTVGLGLSPLDSPISLPGSLLEEIVDLTEMGRKVSTLSSGSTSSRDQNRTERLSARPTPLLSTRSTPYLSESQNTTPNISSNFTSPMPQTPCSLQSPNPAAIQTILASPAPIHSPPIIKDNTTKYTVTSRKPNLRYAKSFSSDVGGKVSRNFSWRGKSAGLKKVPDLATCEKVEMALEKEKRLSRSFSGYLRTRSPVPLEMRYTEASLPIKVETVSRTIQRQPSNGDIHRWRPPTLYSLCSPDGAVDPLPTPPRPSMTPYVSITAPVTPDPLVTPMIPAHKSPFLVASTSFRGSFKSLTKSISRTFDRHHPNDQVKSADSALKAKISGPLEVMPEKDRYSIRYRTQHDSVRPEVSNRGAQEWRETLLSQAVSHSIKDGLCELANTKTNTRSNTNSTNVESQFDPSSMGRSDRTSWSRSVGKTFGLRGSSNGLVSSGENSGSYSRLSKLLITEGNTRGLKEVGKEESNMSVYSTASYLPQLNHSRAPIPDAQPEPNHPYSLASPSLSSPPIDDTPQNSPFVPTRNFASPVIQPYAPQPLLTTLSSLSANQIPLQGKEERVKKVLNWRREVGDDDHLESMIQRHVETEGEVLRGIMKRTSVGPGSGI